MEIVHNHDNDHLDWLFHWSIFPLRESTSIMSGNGKEFTLEELFRSPFTEFSYQFHQKRFQSLVDGLLNVFFFCFLIVV